MRDFSGLVISDCALASAAASAPTRSLELRMVGLLKQELKADRTGFGAFGFDTVSKGFPGIFRDQLFELGLGSLMRQMGLAGLLVDLGEFCPGI
jgi:hypothetical protein